MACGSDQTSVVEALEKKLLSLRIETLQTQVELQSIQIAELEAKTAPKKAPKKVVKIPKSKPKERTEPPREGERFTMVLDESELVGKKIPTARVAVGLTTEPIGEPVIFGCVKRPDSDYVEFVVAEGPYEGKYLDKYQKEKSAGKNRVVLYDGNGTTAQKWLVEKVDGGFSLTPVCSLDRPEGKKSLTIGEDGLVLCKTEFTPVTFRYI